MSDDMWKEMAVFFVGLVLIGVVLVTGYHLADRVEIEKIKACAVMCKGAAEPEFKDDVCRCRGER